MKNFLFTFRVKQVYRSSSEQNFEDASVIRVKGSNMYEAAEKYREALGEPSHGFFWGHELVSMEEITR
jgi:hypothetical protein